MSPLRHALLALARGLGFAWAVARALTTWDFYARLRAAREYRDAVRAAQARGVYREPPPPTAASDARPN